MALSRWVRFFLFDYTKVKMNQQNAQQINRLNRQAPRVMRMLYDVVAFIPRRFIQVPNRGQINDMNELVSQVRNVALRKLLINIITILVVIVSVIKFYKSDFFFNLVTTSGQAMFIKNYSAVLVYIFDVTKFLQSTFPGWFNTINAVVPAYSAKLLNNILTDLPGTLKRYKTLGMKRTNVASLATGAAIGVSLNTGRIPGGSVAAAVGALSINGIRTFMRQASTMNVREIERAYGAVSTTGLDRQVRNYIEAISGQAIRNVLTGATTIIAQNAAAGSVSLYVLSASNQQLLGNFERMGILGVENLPREPDRPALANRPHQN